MRITPAEFEDEDQGVDDNNETSNESLDQQLSDLEAQFMTAERMKSNTEAEKAKNKWKFLSCVMPKYMVY